jgi:peptide/nickel transport system ATP-binding protein
MELTVGNLNVNILKNEILKDVSFSLPENVCVGIIGGSGSGKTMFARTIMGLLPETGIPSGSYTLDGEVLDPDAKERAWRRVRGSKIGLVMQDSYTSLDPTRRCGDQITAGLPHERRKVFDLSAALEEVGLSPEAADRYPFELSGGMRQRVAIAAALATEPKILIADEATSSLDVITQCEILDLLDHLRSVRGMSLLIITHDFTVVSERTEYLVVFHEGRIVEQGPTQAVIAAPKDPYTKTLLAAAMPSAYRSGGSDASAPAPHAESVFNRRLLTVKALRKRFGQQTALRDVSIYVNEGECVGIVGASGSGKTTLVRCIIGLTKPDGGTIEFSGPRAVFNAQIIFQDPYASLNPALTVRRMLTEALRAAKRPASELESLLDLVDIPHDFLSRKPAQLSGGQRQRIAIARALAPQPRLLLCDESVSALDVIVREQILDTLHILRRKQNLSILFISHDLGVVRRIADRIYVMREAEIVEEGETKYLFENPKHAYTRALLDAASGHEGR